LVITLVSLTNGQSATCEGGTPFAGGSTFNAQTGGSSAQSGIDYGCLGSQPNPAWFYFRFSSGTTANILFNNTNSVDIDYAIWGPFPDRSCANIETGTVAPVYCSFSTGATEEADINPIGTGFYLMLITNFAGTATVIQATVIGGDGVLDNSILVSNSPVTGVSNSRFPSQSRIILTGLTTGSKSGKGSSGKGSSGKGSSGKGGKGTSSILTSGGKGKGTSGTSGNKGGKGKGSSSILTSGGTSGNKGGKGKGKGSSSIFTSGGKGGKGNKGSSGNKGTTTR